MVWSYAIVYYSQQKRVIHKCIKCCCNLCDIRLDHAEVGQPCHVVGMSKLSVLYLVEIVLLRELQCINGKSIVSPMARLLNSFDAGLLNTFEKLYLIFLYRDN